MPLTQLVYVSSFIDEYGTGLPAIIHRSGLGDQADGLTGMTLFSNGNIIQLIEGRKARVQSLFAALPAFGKQFQIIALMEAPVPQACLPDTSIGLDTLSWTLLSHAPSSIALFKLGVAEVKSRLLPSPGMVLMVNFARDYG